MRDEMIQLLLKLGAEDLTKEVYPNKVGKCYLKLKVAKGSYIEFGFDYKEHDEVSVFSSKRNINKYILISEIKTFLFNQGVELNKKEKYAVFLDELHTRKMGVSLDYEVDDFMDYDDGLPFENQRYKVVSVQKNNIENTTFYYFKLVD